ncbi:unnamed protein product [Pedinophyceae sp. YPF-701]|nr:unnamed protein product [Pedinophyceae sp. YPF-701]
MPGTARPGPGGEADAARTAEQDGIARQSVGTSRAAAPGSSAQDDIYFEDGQHTHLVVVDSAADARPGVRNIGSMQERANAQEEPGRSRADSLGETPAPDPVAAFQASRAQLIGRSMRDPSRIINLDIPVSSSQLQLQVKPTREASTKADADGGERGSAQLPERPLHGDTEQNETQYQVFGAPQLPSQGPRVILGAKVERRRDVLWQTHPNRLLKYRSSHLHEYGYIPFLVPRNMKATIMSRPWLHFQTLLLCGLCGVIHGTGLGLEEDDLENFVALFGATHLGSIFNLGQVVVFILALFVSLVLSRWWSVRSLYSKLNSDVTESALLATTILDRPLLPSSRAAALAAAGAPSPAPAPRVPPGRPPPRPTKAQPAAHAQPVRRGSAGSNPAVTHSERLTAAALLLRWINLSHVLTVTAVDAQSRHFPEVKGLNWVVKAVLQTTVGRQATPLAKAARDIGFEDLSREGLVKREEWNKLESAEDVGLPKYLLPFRWSQTLILACADASLVSGETATRMLMRVATMIESASSIFTYVNSQLPYPYVWLVSLVVHFYLLVLAAWFGAVLRVGFSGASYAPDDADNDSDLGTFSRVSCYILLAFANLMFQGLLDIHSLLDNPFGSHPAKFPLRSQITSLINTSQALLQPGSSVPEDLRSLLDGLSRAHDSGAPPRRDARPAGNGAVDAGATVPQQPEQRATDSDGQSEESNHFDDSLLARTASGFRPEPARI